MRLIEPIIFDTPITSAISTTNTEKEPEKIDMGVDFSFFTSDAAKDVKDYSPIPETNKEIKKRTRKVTKVDMDDRIDKKDTQTDDFSSSYNETGIMLRTAIAQSDQLFMDISSDINLVRSSKTLKNKYGYITDLTSSSASLINTKIQAIRELNNSITQGHKFAIEKEKISKATDQDNDDMRMMDMYSAFINTPMGVYTPPSNVPTVQEGILGFNTGTVSGVAMTPQTDERPNLSPEQYAMRMERDPNIETVVVYDGTTGQRFFDVIDKTTGNSVPGVPRPDSFLLDDTTIDVRSGIARNRNLDKVWPLIQANNPAGLIEY